MSIKPIFDTLVCQGIEAPERTLQDQSKSAANWLVTVFNNDVCTYEEVMVVLMLATNCSEEESYIEAWEIDHYGQCVVHRASESECLGAADVISTIGIRVEVSQEL